MNNANRHRLWISVIGLALMFWAAGAFTRQTCFYDTINPTAPASRFTDNGDGTVTDQGTGLQWKRCSEGETWNGDTKACTGIAVSLTWEQALQHADMASYAGHSDWRLPNIKELSSIVERACWGPAISLDVFPPTPVPHVHFWSASPTPISGAVRGINFIYGGDNSYLGTLGSTSVRL